MDLKRRFSILAIILFSCFLLFRIVDWFRADVNYTRGRVLAEAGQVPLAGAAFEKAVYLWPFEPAYHRELVAVYARLAQVSSEEDRAIWLDLTSREAGSALNLNPQNLLTLKSLVSTWLALSQTDSGYQIQSDIVIQRALSLCPNDPLLWYFKALAFLAKGDVSGAEAALDEALHLKPDYMKAQEAKEFLFVL